MFARSIVLAIALVLRSPSTVTASRSAGRDARSA